MDFKDIPIHSLGNELQIAGMVIQGQGKTYAMMFPNSEDQNPTQIRMDDETWRTFLYQIDTLETVLFPNSPNGQLPKTVVRKSQRNIESEVSWAVFRRDGYQCRYCGRKDVGLSVDHVVLWEDLGASVPDNLITSCRKCNKMRGNTPYTSWLTNPYYQKVISKWVNLEQYHFAIEHIRNVDAWGVAQKVPLRQQQRSR